MAGEEEENTKKLMISVKAVVTQITRGFKLLREHLSDQVKTILSSFFNRRPQGGFIRSRPVATIHINNIKRCLVQIHFCFPKPSNEAGGMIEIIEIDQCPVSYRGRSSSDIVLR